MKNRIASTNGRNWLRLSMVVILLALSMVGMAQDSTQSYSAGPIAYPINDSEIGYIGVRTYVVIHPWRYLNKTAVYLSIVGQCSDELGLVCAVRYVLYAATGESVYSGQYMVGGGMFDYVLNYCTSPDCRHKYMYWKLLNSDLEMVAE